MYKSCGLWAIFNFLYDFYPWSRAGVFRERLICDVLNLHNPYKWSDTCTVRAQCCECCKIIWNLSFAWCIKFEFTNRFASVTSQCSNQRSNRQNWFYTKIASHTKHAGRPSIDRKTAPRLCDPRYLLKCDALSCEGVVKTFPWNKELLPVRDFSPSMLLYGALSLFRTNFPRCHALLWFVTSSLASPII